MKNVVEFLAFLGAATALHLSVGYWGAGTDMPAGEAGDATVTLTAASASVQMMVAQWDRPPDLVQRVVVPAPGGDDTSAPSFTHDDTYLPNPRAALPVLEHPAPSLPQIDHSVPPPRSPSWPRPGRACGLCRRPLRPAKRSRGSPPKPLHPKPRRPKPRHTNLRKVPNLKKLPEPVPERPRKDPAPARLPGKNKPAAPN